MAMLLDKSGEEIRAMSARVLKYLPSHLICTLHTLRAGENSSVRPGINFMKAILCSLTHCLTHTCPAQYTVYIAHAGYLLNSQSCVINIKSVTGILQSLSKLVKGMSD